MSAPGHNSSRLVSQLDFGAFSHGDAAQRAQFCQEFVSSLSTFGFVKMVNHGIPGDEIGEVFRWNKNFFDLPLDAKNVAAHPVQPNPHRGYSYVGQEKVSKLRQSDSNNRDGDVVLDLKESFDLGPKNDSLYPNRWPEEKVIPGFRRFIESFYDRCQAIHFQLLHALALGLNLAPTFFQDMCRENTSELRLNHYPGCEITTLRCGTTNRISAHSDFGVLTLLFQDSVGGLEIEDQDRCDAYIPVPCDHPSEMVINIGDCLQRWTNNRLRSTIHRVVLPPHASDLVEDRYSVAYFSKPNRSQVVGVLREFLKEGESPKYKDITAWEYNQEKLLVTY